MNHNICDQFKLTYSSNTGKSPTYSMDSSRMCTTTNIPLSFIKNPISSMNTTTSSPNFTNLRLNGVNNRKYQFSNVSDKSQPSSYSGDASYDDALRKNNNGHSSFIPNINGKILTSNHKSVVQPCSNSKTDYHSSYNITENLPNNHKNHLEPRSNYNVTYNLPNILQKRTINKQIQQNVSAVNIDQKFVNSVQNWLESSYSLSYNNKNDISQLSQSHVDRLLCHESMLSDVDDCPNDLRASIARLKQNKTDKEESNISNVILDKSSPSIKFQNDNLKSDYPSSYNNRTDINRKFIKAKTPTIESNFEPLKSDKKLPKGHFIQREDSVFKIDQTRLLKQSLSFLDTPDSIKYSSLIKICNKLTEMKSTELKIDNSLLNSNCDIDALQNSNLNYMKRKRMKICQSLYEGINTRTRTANDLIDGINSSLLQIVQYKTIVNSNLQLTKTINRSNYSASTYMKNKLR